MAGRFKFKLPPLRVTMRSPSGEVRDHYFPRESKPQHQPAQQIVMKEDQVKCEEQQMVMTEEAGTWMAKTIRKEEETLPSLHEISQKASNRIMAQDPPRIIKSCYSI